MTVKISGSDSRLFFCRFLIRQINNLAFLLSGISDRLICPTGFVFNTTKYKVRTVKFLLFYGCSLLLFTKIIMKFWKGAIKFNSKLEK